MFQKRKYASKYNTFHFLLSNKNIYFVYEDFEILISVEMILSYLISNYFVLHFTLHDMKTTLHFALTWRTQLKKKKSIKKIEFISRIILKTMQSVFKI